MEEVKTPVSANSYSSILRESADIADKRGEKYGEVAANLEDTCDIAYAMFGKDWTPIDIAEMLIALKTSREKYCHQEDNTLDTINYHAIRLYLLRLTKKIHVRVRWEKRRIAS